MNYRQARYFYVLGIVLLSGCGDPCNNLFDQIITFSDYSCSYSQSSSEPVNPTFSPSPTPSPSNPMQYWVQTATPNLAGRTEPSFIVTNQNELIIWGGTNSLQNLNDGAVYNPTTNSWTTMTTTNAPEGRFFNNFVWTGSQMLIWGGYLNSGGLYNPLTDTWTTMTQTNAPAPRGGSSGIWTGSTFIAFGGEDSSGNLFYDGGIYDPTSDSWTPIGNASIPAMAEHCAFWTGSEMLSWDGVTNFTGTFNPSTSTWTKLPSSPLSNRSGALVFGREPK